MAKQVWYPEEGDPVKLEDGRTGSVTSETIVSLDEGSWQVEVELDEAHIENEDETRVSDVEVSWSEENSRWEEDT